MKLKIKLHPNSSQEKIEFNEHPRAYPKEGREPLRGPEKSSVKIFTEGKIWLKEKAIDGKANLKLIKILKEYFGKDVEIKSGFKSRRKVVEVK